MLVVQALSNFYSFVVEDELSLLSEGEFPQEELFASAFVGEVGDEHLSIFASDSVLGE